MLLHTRENESLSQGIAVKMGGENQLNGTDCLNNLSVILNLGDYEGEKVYLIRHRWLGNWWSSNGVKKVGRVIGLKS